MPTGLTVIIYSRTMDGRPMFDHNIYRAATLFQWYKIISGITDTGLGPTVTLRSSLIGSIKLFTHWLHRARVPGAIQIMVDITVDYRRPTVY